MPLLIVRIGRAALVSARSSLSATLTSANYQTLRHITTKSPSLAYNTLLRPSSIYLSLCANPRHQKRTLVTDQAPPAEEKKASKPARSSTTATKKKPASLKPRKATTKIKSATAKPRKASAKKKSAPTKRRTASTKPKSASTKRRTASTKSKSKSKPKTTRRRLTEKQKENKTQKDLIARIKQLKIEALDVPKKLPTSKYALFITESFPKKSSEPLAQTSRDLASKYRVLAPDERARLEVKSEENRAFNLDAYSIWLKHRSPEQIRLANLARRRLRVIARSEDGPTKRVRAGKYPKLQDARQIKRPHTAFLHFLLERQAAGKFDGGSVADGAKATGVAFKALSPAELKIYEDKAAASKEKYLREYKQTYGHDTPSEVQASRAKAAAAAL